MRHKLIPRKARQAEECSVEQPIPSPPVLILLLTAAATFLLCPASRLHAAEDRSPTSNSEKPWNLQADRLLLQREKKVIQAYGNVILKKGESLFQADYARYNWEEEHVRLRGNIRIKQEKSHARGEEASFHLAKETGWIREGTIFLHDPHLYVSGQNLQKIGPRTYSFQKATLTSCDDKPPDWSLKSSQGKVTLEGYATMWHPRFRIRNTPIFYSPFMLLPAKRKRQSGFLIPGYSTSTRDGQSVTIPYFQVINQEQDLTLYAHSMSKRGTMLGAEYRLTPNLKSKGIFRFDWLSDQKKEESFQDFEDYERPSDERYWLRGRFNGFLMTPEWRTKLDLDLVSDKYYLREFDYGLQGFEQTQETFMDEFGRDIADKDDPVRENVFSINRNWADASLRTRLEYNQNLNYFRDNPGENPTLQRLPQIDLDLHRRSLLDSPLEWEAKNQATHFWRRKEDEFKGTRLDMHPRIRLPLQSAYGTVTPSLGWRETLYHTQETEENGSQPAKFETRGIWDFSSSASTEIFRIFRLNSTDELEADSTNRGESQWSMIKHTVRPQVSYDYIPEVDQADLPKYDSLDRIGKQNEVTYSLSNLFTLRKDQVVATSGANGTRYERDKQYRELLSLKLEQSYDINESRRSDNLESYPRRPFSDIRMKAKLNPFSWISLTDTTWYSPYVDAVTEHQHRLDLSAGPLSTFFAYDYLRDMEEDIHRSGQDKLSIMRLGATLNPDSNWLLSYDTERNLETSKLIERQAALGYRHQCWNIRVIYTEKPDETRVSFTVGLVPFGEMQQRLFQQEQGIFTQEEE